MIERNIVSERLKQIQIKDFITTNLPHLGVSNVRTERTPLGDKVAIETSRPGMVVGRRGKTISSLTTELKSRFSLNNPEIRVMEIKEPYLDPYYVADKIASAFERYGTKRFKGVMYINLERIMSAGAMGAEIIISGKVPSDRAKTWRSSAGYLKKSGDIAIKYVRSAKVSVTLKLGTVGIKVKIMPPGIMLPDEVIIASSKNSTTQSPPQTQETKAKEVKESKKE